MSTEVTKENSDKIKKQGDENPQLIKKEGKEKMSKKIINLTSEKYNITILENEEYTSFLLALKHAVDVATSREVDFKGAMKLLNKMHHTISKVTNVKIEVVDCLTIDNISDIIKTCKTYDEFQKILRDLINLYDASKKVNAQGTYSLMNRKKWECEYDYWLFEEDNEEMMEYLNMYKSIKPYSMFKFASHINIEI